MLPLDVVQAVLGHQDSAGRVQDGCTVLEEIAQQCVVGEFGIMSSLKLEGRRMEEAGRRNSGYPGQILQGGQARPLERRHRRHGAGTGAGEGVMDRLN